MSSCSASKKPIPSIIGQVNGHDKSDSNGASPVTLTWIFLCCYCLLLLEVGGEKMMICKPLVRPKDPHAFFYLLRLYCQARENHTSLIIPQRILLNVTIAFGHLLSRRGREGHDSSLALGPIVFGFCAR